MLRPNRWDPWSEAEKTSSKERVLGWFLIVASTVVSLLTSLLGGIMDHDPKLWKMIVLVPAMACVSTSMIFVLCSLSFGVVVALPFWWAVIPAALMYRLCATLHAGPVVSTGAADIMFIGSLAAGFVLQRKRR